MAEVWKYTQADIDLADEFFGIMEDVEDRWNCADLNQHEAMCCIASCLGRVSFVNAKKAVDLIGVFMDPEMKARAEEAVRRYMEVVE